MQATAIIKNQFPIDNRLATALDGITPDELVAIGINPETNMVEVSKLSPDIVTRVNAGEKLDDEINYTEGYLYMTGLVRQDKRLLSGIAAKDSFKANEKLVRDVISSFIQAFGQDFEGVQLNSPEVSICEYLVIEGNTWRPIQASTGEFIDDGSLLFGIKGQWKFMGPEMVTSFIDNGQIKFGSVSARDGSLPEIGYIGHGTSQPVITTIDGQVARCCFERNGDALEVQLDFQAPTKYHGIKPIAMMGRLSNTPTIIAMVTARLPMSSRFTLMQAHAA